MPDWLTRTALTRRLPLPRTRPELSLALQGGGAHGAFTWGVLDRLLDSHDLRAVTGTSAGAVNAVALATGLASGGPEGARQSLQKVWTSVGSASPMGLLVRGTPDAPEFTRPARAAVRLSRQFSPYQLNPWDLDPLRNLLKRHLDFDALRDPAAPRVSIAATNARTGRLRVFGNDEITVDTVLASACLPAVHKAVKIDGDDYWDGGYSANPPLTPLLNAQPRDALVVLICPTGHDALPRTSTGIRAREAEFAFTASFLREAELLAEATQRAAATRSLLRGALERRLTRLRWHVLDAGPALTALAAESRMIAHGPFLRSLFDKGRSAAAVWLGHNGTQIGRRSSADLASLTPLPA